MMLCSLLAAVLPLGSDVCSSAPTDLTQDRSLSAVRVLKSDEITVDDTGFPTGAWWPEGSNDFTWVTFGDTQDYEFGTNASFNAVVDWIVANGRAKGVRFVSHLGDTVEHSNDSAEWAYARYELNRIAAHVPLCIAPGNHDQAWGDTSRFVRELNPARLQNGPSGATIERFLGFTGTNWMNCTEYLQEATEDADVPIDPVRDIGTVGGDGANFCLFVPDANGRQTLFFHLQCSVPKPVLDWVDGVLARHPDDDAFIVEHEYLGRAIFMLPYKSPDERNNIARMRSKRYAQNASTSAQYQWERLWSRHANVRAVLCGHEIEGLSDLFEERGDAGNPVLSAIQNYPQTKTSTWLRLWRFDRANDRICVYTYSPYHRRLCRGDEHEFQAEHAFATNLPHHFVIDLAALRRRTRTTPDEPLLSVGDDPRGKPYRDLRPIKDGYTFWSPEQAVVSRVWPKLENGRLAVRYYVINDYDIAVGNYRKGRIPRHGTFSVHQCVTPRFWIDDGAGRRPVEESAVIDGGKSFSDGGWKTAVLDLARIGIAPESLTNAVITVALIPESK